MKQFTDRTGRRWTLDINVEAVKRVRKLLAVDLLKVLDDKCELLRQLGTDLALLVDVLYALVQPEAAAAGVTDEEFGRAFSGDVIMAARDAFFAELTDFFPDPRARTLLAEILAKGERLRELVMDGTAGILAGVDPQTAADGLLAQMRATLPFRGAKGPKTSSGSAPASSRSTPRRLRSAS